QDATQFGRVSDAYIDAREVTHTATIDEAAPVEIPWGPRGGPAPDADLDTGDSDLPAPLALGSVTPYPLGTIIGARSGDKGGAANVGFWARDDRAWAWLAHYLTVERLCVMLPEAACLPIRRHVFANLRALNFVIDGLLGDGVAASSRFDP